MVRNTALVFTLLICSSAFAQKAAVFAGYQLTHFGGSQLQHFDPLALNTSLNGWDAAITGNVARYFGITGDFSGVYESGSKLHTYTVGPEIHAEPELGEPELRIRPFVHALFGGYTSDGPVSQGATTGFAMYYGGGLDIKARRLISVRVAQFDWLVTRSRGIIDQKNFRYSGGLVLRF